VTGLKKEAGFTRNVLGVAAVEFLWGLGFPIVLESTFLQLFLKSQNASSFAVGIVPALFIFGISIAPLFASYLSRNRRRKRPLVIYLHVATGLAILLFGAALALFPRQSIVLPLFFFSYTVFSLCIGLTIPIWLDYLMRLFVEARVAAGLGYMMIAQNIGKIVASFFIMGFVEAYAFSLRSSAAVFIATGLLFVAGSFCFYLTRETAEQDEAAPDRTSFLRHIGRELGEICDNRRFLTFQLADLDANVILTVMSFYANYATGFFGVAEPVAAGIFVACIYAGAITVNVIFGTMNLLGLKQKLVLGKFVTLALLALLICRPGLYTFLAVSYLLGFGRSIRNMIYAPSVKKFTGRKDATSYFALAPIFTIPVATGLPLLFGQGLDILAAMGADGYRLLFGFCAGLVLVTLYFALRTDYAGAGGGS
jgi:MFS family permease